jgi:glyoxylase-like metal-dependent hydrolase (beta-lactamase superfamily II)
MEEEKKLRGMVMLEEITDNFYMLTLPMPFRLMHVHAFIAVDNDGISLFDTGLNTPETFVRLEESLQGIGKTIGDIKRIFITHYHIDHCGMAGRLQNISGARIHMSEQSRPFILRRDDGDDEEFLFVDRIKDFCLIHGLPGKAIDLISGLFMTFKKAGSSFTIDEYYRPGRRVIVGGKEMQVIPTPGHTHDHVSFYFPQERILLSGDHVLPEITPNLSPNLFAPEFCPLRSYLDSLSQMEALSVEKVYPAHGQPFSNLKGRIEAICDHHRIRKRLTYESVQRGAKTTFVVSQDIFGVELPEFDQFLALNETYVHLIELVQEGLLREERAAGLIFYSVAP